MNVVLLSAFFVLSFKAELRLVSKYSKAKLDMLKTHPCECPLSKRRTFSTTYIRPLWLSLLCGLYYKPMTIVNDDSRVINKLETSLTDDARVVIYDCHMFMYRPLVC